MLNRRTVVKLYREFKSRPLRKNPGQLFGVFLSREPCISYMYFLATNWTAVTWAHVKMCVNASSGTIRARVDLRKAVFHGSLCTQKATPVYQKQDSERDFLKLALVENGWTKPLSDCGFCATDASQPEADEPLAHARREISPAPQNPGPDGLFPRSFSVE